MNSFAKSPGSATDLPQPAAAELERSARLHEHIRELIQRQHGYIGFDQYMETALYQPGAGYYVSGLPKFGTSGDFTTAPESGELFGRCLARQCDQILATTGGDIIEFGAGSGALAAQLLQYVTQLPERYLIVETSAELMHRQRQSLQTCSEDIQARVSWITELPASMRGVVVANELLDAMPVVRFVISEDESYPVELGVGIDEQQLVHRLRVDGPHTQKMTHRFADLDLAAGYCSEFNPRAEAWLATIAQHLQEGVLLAIDYGYPFAEYYNPSRMSGTLRCHYRHHAHEDALLWPGLQDITAHVDFTNMANAGLRSGLELAGYSSQANFLMSLGLVDFVAVDESQSDIDRIELTAQVNRLTSPSAMGEAFKVLALSRDFDEELQGFYGRDQRHMLFQA